MAQNRFFIMRHGETVFNAARRLQSNTMHTPLTRRGCEQAVTMGEKLREELGEKPELTIHVSEAGRAQQTAALICGELGIDFFDAHRTDDLVELDMGEWCGRAYADVEAEHGSIVLDDHLLRPSSEGEDYRDMAARLTRWLERWQDAPGDHLVIMHGLSSRVLRGLMTGRDPHHEQGAPVAPSLIQGSISLVENGKESVLYGSDIGNRHA